MRRLALIPMLALLLPAGAVRAEQRHSRVIVSTTLDSTLEFFDAETLQQTQPPLLSRGLGPVRMVVTSEGGAGSPRLFTANHGVAEGSVGMFDLSGDTVTEMPLSPFPARPGSVGIDAAMVTLPSGRQVAAVLVTNTTFALGGCGMPKGSITAFERLERGTIPYGPHLEVLVEAGTVDVDAPIPYGVAIAGPHGQAYATTNCGNSLNAIDIAPVSGGLTSFAVSNHGGAAGTDSAPDGVLYDARTDMVYVAAITGSTLAAFSPAGGAVATVPLPKAHPIDIALADSPGGHHWVITSNGGDDSVSLVDRDVLGSCSALCPQAETLRIPTGVPGGAPEGVAYDPVSNRIFVVNKTILAPSLTVIQIDESSTSVSAHVVKTIPLSALGDAAPQIPAFIAFDVVVQTR